MKALLCLCALFLVAASSPSRRPWNVTGDIDSPLMTRLMRLKLEEHRECVAAHLCPTIVPAVSNVPCVDGKSGEYDCNNVDLLSFVPLKDMGGQSTGGNDIWGWTDPETKKEYAIVGLNDGTSFVDVTDPFKPSVLAFLPTQTSNSLWRDIKVFKDHAFIVSEASRHGMQVYDLTHLRSMSGSSSPVQVSADAFYDSVSNTHNIVGNEETGFMYAVGSTSSTGVDPDKICGGGLHMIDVNDPLNPKYAGCFGGDGYVHDAQCVIYKGPDTSFQDKEICFCYNENTLTIVDVENKEAPEMLSRVPYNNAYYTHQGWLNEDQTHLLLNDELDEMYGPTPNTRTMIWNVLDLKDPKLEGSFYSEKQAVDHNLYIRDNLVYESNYCAGLRILDVSGIDSAELTEMGYFDVDPDCDSPRFNGAWSSYVYFESETIILSSIERGLFVLKYTGPKP